MAASWCAERVTFIASPAGALPAEDSTAAPSGSKKASASSTADKGGKKGAKHAKKSASADSGWISDTWRPLPKDVAIVGLILVFAGTRWVVGEGRRRKSEWQATGVINAFAFALPPAWPLPLPPAAACSTSTLCTWRGRCTAPHPSCCRWEQEPGTACCIHQHIVQLLVSAAGPVPYHNHAPNAGLFPSQLPL